MGGPITALADDYTGAFENPAGSALTLGGIDLTISAATIEDHLHNFPSTKRSHYMGGLAIPFDGVGTSLGYSIPFSAVSPANEEVQFVEYRIAASKTFLEKRLALGLGIGWGTLKLDASSSTHARFIVGGLYRFPKRVFLGLSYIPGTVYEEVTLGKNFSVPHQLSLGVGWIPNRFFRGGISLKVIPSELSVYSFHTPDVQVGRQWAFQPHFGIDYHFIHLKKIRGRVFLGSYLESTRGEGTPRIHFTTGTEIQFWFLKTGAAIDIAHGYQNISFGIGADLGEILRKLQLFPPELQAPSGGLLPHPFEISDDWLATQLQDHPEEAFQSIGPDLNDFKKSLEHFPKNIKKMRGFDKDIDEMIEE